MLIIILMIILILLFAVWTIFSLYELAILFLVNLVLIWLIGFRAIHDLKDKKNMALYLVSVSISFFLIMFKDITGLDEISRFLSRFLIIDTMKVILLIFIIAQIMLIIKKKFLKK